MKMTLTKNKVADELMKDSGNNGYSYEGCLAIAEYLEGLEEDTGEEIEFDAVAIRCEYSEYESAKDAATEYGFEPDEDEDFDEEEAEDACLDFLKDRTQVIEFPGGVIVQCF